MRIPHGWGEFSALDRPSRLASPGFAAAVLVCAVL